MKTLSVVVIYLFSCLASTFAYALETGQINIPEEYGWISEQVKSEKSSNAKSALIINIQDAHCTYSAQKNIYNILRYLIDQHQITLIGVEGGSGNCGLSYLRQAKPQKERMEIAEGLLKEGKIAGEEYLDIVSDYQLTIWGIEDEKLYKENIKCFYEIQEVQTQLNDYLKEIKEATDALKPKLYCQALLEFEKLESDYSFNKIDTAQFISAVAKFSLKENIDLSDFSDFDNYAYVLNKEDNIDFEAAEKELNGLLVKFNELFDERNSKILNEKIEQYKEAELGEKDFYSFIFKLTIQSDINLLDDYPNLFGLIMSKEVSEKFDKEKALQSIDSVVSRVKAKLVENQPDASRLLEISQDLNLLDKFVNIRVTPQDFSAIKEKKESLVSQDEWLSFLKSRLIQFSLKLNLPDHSSMVKQHIEKFFKFYQVANLRDQKFLENIARKMKELNRKVACVITGGFHSQGLKELLKENGYDYLIVTPIVKDDFDYSRYYSLLRERSSLKK